MFPPWIYHYTHCFNRIAVVVMVVSQFNGTSTPKGSYSAKTGDNDCNVNSSRYSLSTGLCANSMNSFAFTTLFCLVTCSRAPDLPCPVAGPGFVSTSPQRSNSKHMSRVSVEILSTSPGSRIRTECAECVVIGSLLAWLGSRCWVVQVELVVVRIMFMSLNFRCSEVHVEPVRARVLSTSLQSRRGAVQAV